MNERSYNLVQDKATWGDGPWLDEPDKVVWVDDATGLDCMMVRNRSGAWCGYVGVPQGHPWHGKGYSECLDPTCTDDACWEHSIDVQVHGGLTFAAPCQEGAREDEGAVCHNPVGRPDNVWWLGFDCNHAFDFAPAMHTSIIESYTRRGEPVPDCFKSDRMGGTEVYRNVAYARGEVESLARQARGTERDRIGE